MTSTVTSPGSKDIGAANHYDGGKPSVGCLVTTTDDDDIGCQDPEDDCFFDDDDASPDVGIPSAKLEMPDLDWPALALPVDRLEGDDDEMSVLQSVAGPPSEINIDLCGAPTSPMRDPSVIFAAARVSRTPQDNYGLLDQIHYGDDVMRLDQQLELETKLCDAERLVRVVIGKPDNAKGNFASLEQGSILEAIRTFAIMKKELLELRQQQERKDGDPLAILTNLTSPASTRQSADFSNFQTSSPASPSSLDIPGPRSDDSPGNHRQFDVVRKALVLAAKKCQSMEQQLKHADETIEQLRRDHAPAAAVLSKTPEELEEILAKLHGLPASAVSREERRKIRSYVNDIIQTTKEHQHQEALQESRRREESARQELEAAKEKIAALQLKFCSSTAIHETEIPSPLLEMSRQMQEKDERIAQLEASQARFQSLLQTAMASSRSPLEVPMWPNSTERLKMLEKEHKDLADSVRMLEGQAIQL